MESSTAMSNGVSASVNSDHSGKYDGMVHQSGYKKLRNKLSELYNYIYADAPYMVLLHAVITFFRIFQFIGPGLYPACPQWGYDTKLQTFLSVISVLFQLIPQSEHVEGIGIFLIVYIIIMVLFAILIVGSAYYFAKFAKLSTSVSITLLVFFGTANFVFHPIALNFALEMISRLIFTEFEFITVTFDIVLIVLTLAIFIAYCWNFIVILSQTLTFRPTSLMTVMTLPSILLFLATNILNGLIGFAAVCPKMGRYIILILCFAIYGSSAALPWIYGGFVKRLSNSMATACGIEGSILCMLCFATTISDSPLSFVHIIVAFVLFPILVIIFNIVNHRVACRNLALLDYYQENKDIDALGNKNYIYKVTIDGIISVHEVCITWLVFRDAITKWPKDAGIWFIFAKFVAVYPEDVQTLSWIYHSVVTEKLKGITARTLKSQTLSITRQRESTLSPGLKSKLNAVQKTLIGAKHKLRHVWDLAIQGNVSEMEAAVKRAYIEQERNEAEFKHLFRQFPNNRFVTRTYARFAKEIKANHVEYLEYLEKSRLLQRGTPVCIDQAHESAIRAFPSLPNRITVKKQDQNVVTNDFQSIEDQDDDQITEEPAVSTFRESIEGMRIPAITGTRCMRFWLFLIVFMGYLIAMFVYSMSFIHKLIEPLDYFKWIAHARLNALDIGMFAAHQAYEMFGVYRPPIPQKVLPSYLGGEWNTRNMLKYSMKEATHAAQEMTAFQEYDNNDTDILKAKDWIFGYGFYYTYKYSEKNKTKVFMDIQTAIVSIVNDATVIANMPQEAYVNNDGFVNTTGFLGPIANCDGIAALTFKAGKNLISYSKTQYGQTVNETKIINIAAITVTCGVFITEMIIQVIWIQRNKDEAYKCLTSLPKNVVSELVENLRVLKNDDGNEGSSMNNNTEINKQEDNILKTFMTGGNETAKVADRIMLIFTSIIIIIISVICTILFTNLYKDLAWNMVKASPHLFYISGAFTKFFESQYMIQLLGLREQNHPLREYQFDDGYLEERFIDLVVTGREYYQSARWGGIKEDEAPFDGYMKTMVEARKLVKCDSQVAVAPDFMHLVECWNVDALLILSDSIMTKYFEKSTKSRNTTHVYKIDYSDMMLDYLWSMLIVPIYEGLYAPMFNSIIPTITETLNTEKVNAFTIVAVLLIVAAIFEAITFVQISFIERHIKHTLMLLLHANAQVIMNVPKINQVISGDFSRRRGDMARRSVEFYDAVYQNMPDAVIIFNPINRVIESVNRSCARIFNMKESELVGINIHDFLKSEKFTGDSSALFSSTDVSQSIQMVTTDQEGGQMNLTLQLLVINRVQAIIIRDVTAAIRYNKLIRDERSKSDKLLESILPSSLVKRVQNGEKNISFAVQSATILFMDIVSFTPWCGSNEATKVMMTLNLLFKKFDNALAKYATATKIKCIGDCYMAAGGIFAEANQPAEHAKEIVAFGIDSLECVKEIDQELDEKLQMRVGINTGGPIVAGVLGIGKPTFEILGPAINMAQQMEHHGVPMAVQISRPVYELIYGDTFKIKERGNVEVKNGTVVTYLVSRA